MHPFVRPSIALLTLSLIACEPVDTDRAPDLGIAASALLSVGPAAPGAEIAPARPTSRAPAPDQNRSGERADPRDEAPAQIRGIYLNASAAGTPERLSSLLDLADRTEINAFVVDVKTEAGLHYPSANPITRELSPRGQITIESLSGLVDTLHEHGIHAIARIVAFKDPVLVAGRSAWAIRRPDGGIWIDREGNHWVSAWNPEVWEYNIDIAIEAAEAGFDEVQFDYVRFPEAYQSLPTQIHPAAPEGSDKTAAIVAFLSEAQRRMEGLDVIVAADVFGMSMNAADDVGIGQQWERLGVVADHLLPMVYPSHYFPTHLPDVANPNRMPRLTIETAVGMGVIRNERIAAAGATPPRIIPWLQAFDAPWVDRDVHYGAEAATAQMEGVYEVGLEDWIFWHPGSRYQAIEAAFRPELTSRARPYDAPASLVNRMDRYEGWGMRASRERALRDR